MASLRSLKSDLDSQILEDAPTSLDVMWASSQSGCGPLKRLLMEVEPIRQLTQASSDSKQSFGLGRTKKASSAPATLVPSGPSTSAGHCSDQSQLRPMKRIRSGPHVFAKELPAPADDDKIRPSQSFDLLGGGKFATEMLARVSRSLNQKAISEYSNSQKKPISGQQSSIISERSTQPLQAQSNIIHNRNYNVPSKSAMIKQSSNHDLKTESALNGSNKITLMKPLTNLKDSPKRGRLKALLKTIDHDNIGSSSGSNHHRTILPVRNTLPLQERSEGSSKGKSIGMGRISSSVNHIASEKQQTASSSNLASVPFRRTSREAGFDVQHTTAKSTAKSRKNTVSPPPRLQSRRTYRAISQDAKVDSMSSFCLSDDEEKLPPVTNGPTSAIETPVDSVDSIGEGDDYLYNDANSSSSYGDIDIDLSLLENVCKKYDT